MDELYRATFARLDRMGWKKFVSAMAALGTAFLMAIYSSVFAQQGRLGATAVCASLALLLSGYVALTAVPYLARRAGMEWLRISIDYQLTQEGVAFIAVVFLLAVAGLNTGNNLLFLVVACLLSAILMSGVLSLTVLSGLRLEVLLPENVFARRAVPARIRLENQKKFLPSFSITLTGSGDGTAAKRKTRRSKKDSSSTISNHAGILRQAIYFPFLPAARTLARPVELLFPHRGLYTEKGFFLSTRFPFGFLEKKLEIRVARELIVYPGVEPTNDFYEILPALAGELETFQRGRGCDLYSIRNMLPTDSARHVDWKASARTGDLKVREFTREDDRRLQLVFDRRMGPLNEASRRRFEAGVEFCACVAWHFHEIDAQLQFLSDDFQTVAGRTGDLIFDILRYLAAVEPSPEEPAEPLMIGSAESIFRIVLTGAAKGTIPASAWSGSYFIFMESLRTDRIPATVPGESSFGDAAPMGSYLRGRKSA